MAKLNIKIPVKWTLILVMFLFLNLLISDLFIPKFIESQDLLINLDFNTKSNIESYLNSFENLTFKYSKENVFIDDSAGNNDTPALMLDVKDKKGFIHIVFDNNNYSYIKLEATARIENIIKNSKKFPKIILVTGNDSGKINWNYLYVAKNFVTIFKWKKFENYFHIPYFAEKINLIIINNSITGKLICDDIKLTPHKINSAFKIYRLILFFILFLYISILIYFNRKFLFQFYKQISILFIIIIGILGPKEYLIKLALYYNFDELLIQKAGHFFLFSLLSFAILINKKYFNYENNKQFVLLIITEVFLIAVLTELLQFFTFSRSMSIFDILIDTTGILLGIIISYFYLYLINLKIKK